MVSPPIQQPAEEEEETREGDVVVEAKAGADEAAEEHVEEKVETEKEDAAYETVRRELCDAEGQKFRGTWNLECLAHTAVCRQLRSRGLDWNFRRRHGRSVLLRRRFQEAAAEIQFSESEAFCLIRCVRA